VSGDGELPPGTLSPRATWDWYLERGLLAFQVDATGAAVFPPRAVAPMSAVEPLRWEVCEGRGTVYAATFLHARDTAPRSIVLVDLDEGFRFMSRLEPSIPPGVDTAAPAKLVGARVRLVLEQRDDPPLPVFELEPSDPRD
jgi:uncharacterized protein